MASNRYNHNQSQNKGTLYDTQDSSSKMLSPRLLLTGEQQSESQMKTTKKKCHGNRKLQHFKRKCRARGLTEEQIKILIQNRNNTISETFLSDQTTPEHVHQSCKRKRDEQSLEKSLDSSAKSMNVLE